MTDKQTTVLTPKMARTQPGAVCRSCGEIWGVRWPRGTGCVSSMSPGTCGVCGKEALVTEARDFGHLRVGWQTAKREAL